MTTSHFDYEGREYVRALETERNDAQRECERLEARVRELEAEAEHRETRIRELVSTRMAAEQKLADANALLGRWLAWAADAGVDGEKLERDTDAHLAGQPAAPACALGEVRQYDGHAWVRVDSLPPLVVTPAAPSRTEALTEWDAWRRGERNGTHDAWGNVRRGIGVMNGEPADAVQDCAAHPSRTEAEQAVLDACAAAEFTWEGHLAEEASETAIGRAELARRGLK